MTAGDTSGMTQEALLAWLVDWVAGVLGGADVDPDARLDELGLASRDAVAMSGELEDLLDRTVPPTLAWEYPSLRALAAGLTGSPAEEAPPATAAADRLDPREPIAIVGVGCRVPGADGPDAFWELLADGRDAIGEVPAGRWAASGTDDPSGRVPRLGGFLADVAGFDAGAFGITPREAALIDPQQRLLLEVAVEALAHARIDPESLRGSETGVFVGISSSEYGHLTAHDLDDIEPWTATGAALSIAANRLSYALDLTGPSLAVDTACSSSLVALHTACAALHAGEASAALVGGVNLLLTPLITASFAQAGALAADGRCKSFAADADGIGRGEGCGVVVLKRLSDATADGDRVLAVVRGSAVNSDGRSNGLTAPNPRAQEAVLRAAYARSGVDPTTVDYLEAHGTGTMLGDPIEAAALGRVLGAGRSAERPLLLGSVKSNLGHLESAAGIVGVIKLALALSRDALPPSLHAERTSPHIPFADHHLEVVTAARPWPRYDGVARAGVSGFGFGGTNAHVVLEQAPPAAEVAAPPAPTADVLVLSARTDETLATAAADLADWLEHGRGAAQPATVVARSLAHRRADGPVRTAVAGRDRPAVLAALRAVTGGMPRTAADRPVWVFAGYGQQWAGMGRRLARTEPVFARRLDEVAAALAPYTSLDLAGLVCDGLAPVGVDQAMTSIFGVQLGIAALLREAGITPAAVLGHSLGEVAAAVVAGGLDLADGASVITARGRLLAGLDVGDGAMCLVDASADDVRGRAARFPGLEIAVDSSPRQCTVAGPTAAVDGLVAELEGEGRDAWPLTVGGAGHSAAVEPILADLRAALAGVRGHRPTLPFYGTVLDDPRAVPDFDADYWAANARRTVRFAPAVAAARADGFDTFVEVSAHPVAARALSTTLADAPGASVVLATLRRDADDAVELARTVGLLHAAGHPDLLAARYPAGPECDLPEPAWQHRPHWFAPRARLTATPATPTLGRSLALPGGAGTVWTYERADDVLPIPAGGAHPLGTAAVGALAVAAAAALLGQPAEAVETLAVSRVPGVALPAAAALFLAAARTATGAVEVSLHTRPAGSDVDWVTAAHATVAPVGAPLAAPLVAVADAPVAWQSGVVAAQPRVPVAAPAAAVPTDGPGSADWSDRVRAGTPDAQTLVRARLVEAMSEIMGHGTDRVDGAVPLVDLGLDSLMATRAQHAVERDFGVPLPVRLLLQGMSLDGLAAHLVGQLVDHVPEQRTGAEPQAVTSPPRTGPPVPARNPCERFLVGLCLDLLREPVGVTDGLADHGLGAPEAEVLAAAIAGRVGRSPSPTELVAAGTLESIAELIGPEFDHDPDDPHAVVRVLQPGADRRPLFLFHPAGGPTSVYQPLVSLLDQELPVVGFERLAGAETVEAKATAYVQRIRERQPYGPYRLMGWSLGGLLAMECARQLTAAGEQVELLGSIDTILPRLEPGSDPRSVLVERYRRFAEHVSATYGTEVALPDDISDAPEAEQMERVRAALEDAGIRLPDGVLLHQYTSYVDSRIAERYEPTAYDGEMVLYRASESEGLTTSLDPRYLRSDEALGWDAHVADLVVVHVPGNHITMIDRPHVEVLAADLRSRLAELDWASGLLPAGSA